MNTSTGPVETKCDSSRGWWLTQTSEDKFHASQADPEELPLITASKHRNPPYRHQLLPQPLQQEERLSLEDLRNTPRRPQPGTSNSICLLRQTRALTTSMEKSTLSVMKKRPCLLLDHRPED
ncbi:hypothetical protein ISN44_As13g007990 [Arabidopsis suecica]|uniref:Uncharacterized protein n=1 Tax=Arabidopsis suecica TaxID=45249 RepID=A0A8T1XS11_ARASU|nr:hypothetical protein ISN44_As13g007990 [Arabidopsis suecica]